MVRRLCGRVGVSTVTIDGDLEDTASLMHPSITEPADTLEDSHGDAFD